MYEQARRSAMVNSNAPRPLGSLRQIDAYKDELKKLELPPIHDKQTERQNKVNMLGDNSYEKLKENNKDSVAKHVAFPNIEGAMGVEVKFRYKIRTDAQDKDSLYSAPAGGFDDKTDVGADGLAHVVAFDMGQNLMLMRKKEQERLERQRQLPLPPSSREESRREGWRRVLPATPTRPTSVFPNNTKNSIGMKKLLKREATEVISTWTTTARRMEKVEVVREMDKTRRETNPLPVFDSNRPTSAIIRDFEAYRKFHDDHLSLREQNETDQPIIIRQLSPKPRPQSPVSQRRTEYSRISTPQAKQRDGQLRRVDSEIIPSVSRTASYKQVPDDLVEPHENALLTAAERIELEKRLRNSGKERLDEEDNSDNEKDKRKETRADTPTPKPRRKLPQTPGGEPSTKPKTIKPRKPRKLPEPMFNTAILAMNRDESNIIEKVKEANEVTLEIPDETDKIRTETIKNTEINQYSPTIKRKLTPKIVKVEAKPEMDRTGFVTETSASRLREKLAKKMNFDYDSFSRTVPDAKKQLELRAKQKRKLQLKNAKLAEETYQKKQMASKVSGGEERPRSRVSFNENVIVFQTI